MLGVAKRVLIAGAAVLGMATGGAMVPADTSSRIVMNQTKRQQRRQTGGLFNVTSYRYPGAGSTVARDKRAAKKAKGRARNKRAHKH